MKEAAGGFDSHALPPNPRPAARWRPAAFGWWLALLALHSIPRSGLLSLPGGEELVNSTVYDKFAHAAMFGVLGLLNARAFPGVGAAGLVAAGVAYGGALEVLQGLAVRGRSGSLEDLACDAAGVTLGVLLARRGGRRPEGSVQSK